MTFNIFDTILALSISRLRVKVERFKVINFTVTGGKNIAMVVDANVSKGL